MSHGVSTGTVLGAAARAGRRRPCRMATSSVPHLPQPFTALDAARAGVSRGQLTQAVRVGLAIRVARGLYAAAATWEGLSPEARHAGLARAAYRTCGGAVVSHHSAAVLWELPCPRRRLDRAGLTLLSDRRTSPAPSWMHLHRATLREDDVADWGDLLVTAADRTVLDCLRSLEPGDGVAVGDAALRAGLVAAAGVDAVLTRQKGWPGSRRAARWLPHLDGRRESWLESFSAVVLARYGIAPPEPQVSVYDADGLIGRVDGMWIERGVVAEADGAGKYLGQFDAGLSVSSAVRRVVAEKVREDRLRGVGLEVVRWGTGEIVRAPGGVAARVEAAFGRGSIDRFSGRVVLAPHPVLRALCDLSE
jgi:hypothetical protein